MLGARMCSWALRSFVFDNYTWNKDGGEYSEYNGHLIPSRIPLSTMIAGAQHLLERFEPANNECMQDRSLEDHTRPVLMFLVPYHLNTSTKSVLIRP